MVSIYSYTGWTFEFRTLCPNKKTFFVIARFWKIKFLNDRLPSDSHPTKIYRCTYHTAWDNCFNVKMLFLDFFGHFDFFYYIKMFLKNLFKKIEILKLKWDVQHWVFGSVFWNSPHCLVKHPKKKIFKKKSKK
jgi:hypothetical protein